jgi:type IV pilus assembly protein PilC
LAKYNYLAKDKSGRLVKGILDVFSISEARTVLRGQDLTPVSIKLQNAVFSGLNRASCTSKELQVFSRQFSVLIESGVPILESLSSIAEGQENKKFRMAIDDIVRQISTGRKLSEALALYPGIFDKLYVNLVKAGEEAGVLDEVLDRLSFYIEKSNALKSKITGALWYPMITIVIAFSAVTGVLVFIIPKFQTLFSEKGQALPALTQKVIDLSESLQANWYIYLGVTTAIPVVLMFYYKTPSGRQIIDRILIKIPVFGSLIIKSCVARMSRTLATLLKAGVQLVEAIEITAGVAGNAVLENDLETARKSIIQGRSFVEPLRKSIMIPLMVAQMIAIGEKTGNIDTMLLKIADFYEAEVETAADALTSLIEPLLIVFLGGTVGVLVIAMFLPILNLAGTAM